MFRANRKSAKPGNKDEKTQISAPATAYRPLRKFNFNSNYAEDASSISHKTHNQMLKKDIKSFISRLNRSKNTEQSIEEKQLTTEEIEQALRTEKLEKKMPFITLGNVSNDEEIE